MSSGSSPTSTTYLEKRDAELAVATRKNEIPDHVYRRALLKVDLVVIPIVTMICEFVS